MDYKEGYEKLQLIVEKMNGGDLTLEEMVEKYEEGMELYKELSQQLSTFEQRVTLLNKDMELPLEVGDNE